MLMELTVSAGQTIYQVQAGKLPLMQLSQLRLPMKLFTNSQLRLLITSAANNPRGFKNRTVTPVGLSPTQKQTDESEDVQQEHCLEFLQEERTLDYTQTKSCCLLDKYAPSHCIAHSHIESYTDPNFAEKSVFSKQLHVFRTTARAQVGSGVRPVRSGVHPVRSGVHPVHSGAVVDAESAQHTAAPK